MLEIHEYRPALGFKFDPISRPDLGQLWQLFKARTDQAAKYAADHNLYDPTQRGTVPVDKSNAYHESLIKDIQ